MAYLRLFHGRTRQPSGELPVLDDWGLDGPVFGPFPWFHVTHSAEIQFGDGCELPIVEGLVQYGGVFYGDWSVTDDAVFRKSTGLRAMHAPFLPELAMVSPSRGEA